jgi:voltage-gated potassium channel Kch
MANQSTGEPGSGAVASRTGLVRGARFQRLLALRWADVRWVVLLVLGLVAAVFGYLGYRQVYASLPPGEPEGGWTDYLYHALGLFAPGAGPERPGLPVLLDIARFLAPAVAGYAAITALAVLFRDRTQQIRIPFMTNHIVVCGLGYIGDVFIHHLREDDAPRRDRIAAALDTLLRRKPKRLSRTVVVVELDPTNPLIDKCRQRGVPVIIGDAQSERTLRAAGIRHAAHLLAVTDQDAVNAQIVAIARDMARNRHRRVLHCLARVDNPELCALLRVRELTRELTSGRDDSPQDPCDSWSTLHYFNPDETAARMWLEQCPFVDEDTRHPHLLVSRLDQLGTWLVRTAARLWDETNPSVPLWITIVDEDGEERVADLMSCHPELEQVCRFFPPIRATARDLGRLPELHAEAGAPPLTRAYVTAHRDEIAAEDALNVRQLLPPGIPVSVALSRTHGVTSLVRDAHRTGLDVEVFLTLEQICTKELVEGGSFEPIAKALHERWRAMERKAGQADPPTWDELDESRRRSNFAHARDIKTKLYQMNCVVTPLGDWRATHFTFSPAEVDTLAYQEHERWNADRWNDGWELAEVKDPEKKLSPYLIPFDELQVKYPEIAEYDRTFARDLPAVLASFGLQIKRLEVSPRASASVDGGPHGDSARV